MVTTVTQPVNLEIVGAHLASVLLPTGITLPCPLLILPDNTPLYEEDAVLLEFEASEAEERPAKLDLEIFSLETFNSTLVTVTFGSDLLDEVYRINVPRQYLQVGRMYNSVLKAPAVSILTESEMEGYEAQNSLEQISALFSEDVTLRLFFPEDQDPEQSTEFNQVLNHSHIDFFQDVDSDQLTNLASKVSISVHKEELSEIRAELIDIIISLINGDEDALISLYEHAEELDAATKTIAENTPLNTDERNALLVFEYLLTLYRETSPNSLVTQIVDENEVDDINSFQHLIAEAGMDLHVLFKGVLDKYYEENPQALTITEDSSHQERVDYLTRDSNTIPLLGGLFKLSNIINVDLLYSRNWNDSNVTEEDYVSKGEYAIILALLIAQRIQMFAKVLGDDAPGEVNMLAMAMMVHDLSDDDEPDMWILTEGLKRITLTQPLVFNEFLNLSAEGEDTEGKVYSPFGALMHRFGHTIIEEKWGYESMMIAFEKQPLIRNFVDSLFIAYKEEVAEEEDMGEESETCYSVNATTDLVENNDNISEVIKQLGEALNILAELNVMRSEDFKKDSDEWKEYILQYLSELADSI
jgi:hypothetical protein